MLGRMRCRVRLLTPALLALLLSCGTTARAEDSMRCGNRLVSVGDGKDKVRALCGEPSSISHTGYTRLPMFPPRHPYYNQWGSGPYWVELPVEIWTYNFGSSKLLRKLRFNGDELSNVETDGYGY